jgi:hypothetical protein
MTIPLDSMIGELNIVGGTRQSTTPATGVFTAPRRSARGRAEDTLYVLIDLADKAPTMLIDEMKQQLAKVYWSTPGSVTAALRAAIADASDWLMTHNTEAAVPDRLAGGLSCAVLRHADVFIAQAGPANVYVAHQGSIEQFPAHDAEPLPPIGMSRSVEIRFAHAELQPGDVLLLTDTRSPKNMPSAAIASAIVYVGIETALLNLQKLAGTGDFIALVVETVPARAAAESISIVPSAPTVQSTAASTPAPVRSTPAATTIPSGAKVQTPPPTPIADRAGSKPIGISGQTTHAVKHAVRTVGRGISRGLSALGTLIQRSLPGPATDTRSKSKSSNNLFNNSKFLAGIAIGIAILTGLFASVMFIQNRAQNEFKSLIISAQNDVTTAMQLSGSPARQHWSAALTQIQQALALMPNDQAASDLFAQTQAQLDRFDNIARVTPLVLADFKSSGPLRLALHNFSIFVLDRGRNEVQRVTLNANADGIEGGKPVLVYTAGTSIDNKLPGNLLEMAWVNASSLQVNSSLMVLQRDGLLQYEPTFGPSLLTLGNVPVPAAARRLRAFDGNLYLLDPAAQQIWRYRAKDSQYADAPEKYFEQPSIDAANAIDMAIDGNVYLISADGKIVKYAQSKLDKFKVSGLAEPIGRASVIAVDAEAVSSSVYVVDQTLGRIVQLRPDGQFVRQFRSNDPAFRTITDLAIDERNSHLFFTSGGVLYSVAMPGIQ